MTGAGRTDGAGHSATILPHAAELGPMPGLAAKVEPIPRGVCLTVTVRTQPARGRWRGCEASASAAS
jgi:hypothetical protein